MENLNNEDRLLNGVLRDLVLAADEIGDRKLSSATKARTVEDIATDPHRLALSADYKETLSFINATKRRARELTQRIVKHTSEYDSLND